MKLLIIQMDLTYKSSNFIWLNIMVTPKSFNLNFIYLEIKYNGTNRASYWQATRWFSPYKLESFFHTWT